MNLNDVKIAGNLVQEPELHYTPQGTPVTNVSLGVNETYTLNNEKRTATTLLMFNCGAPPLKTSPSWCRKANKSWLKARFARTLGRIN